METGGREVQALPSPGAAHSVPLLRATLTALDSNQYITPGGEQIAGLQLDSASLSGPLLVMNQHRLPLEDTNTWLNLDS